MSHFVFYSKKAYSYLNLLPETLNILKFKKIYVFSFIILFNFLAFLSNFFETISFIVLSSFLTNSKIELPQKIPILLHNIIQGIQLDNYYATRMLLIFFFLSFLTKIILLVAYKFFSAKVRTYIQTFLLSKILNSRWKNLTSISIGEISGSITNEAARVSKYLFACLDIIYFCLVCFLTLLMLILVSYKISILFFIFSIPFLIIILFFYLLMLRLSKKGAELRNFFSTKVSDRLNGLLQILISNNSKYHISKALSSQNELMTIDIKIGYFQALIGSFNLIFAIFFLAIIYLYTTYFDNFFLSNLGALTAIAVLAIRLVSQVNGLVTSFSNAIDLSGSIFPVKKIIDFPTSISKKIINEKITQISISNLTFFYSSSKQAIFSNFSLMIKRGLPIIIKASSGRGKTTLMNLIVGLHEPVEGEISYISSLNHKFNSKNFLPKIGYVPQNPYLFGDSIKNNLIENKKISKKSLYSVLEQVDAIKFVEENGGIDSYIIEGGKNFSGGQIKRLAIARALISEPDIYIFDEITSGLDKKNKEFVVKLVQNLSRNNIVILISHENIKLKRFLSINL